MSSLHSSKSPEYFSLLPSEICRFILGYLLNNGHHNSAHSLFTESKELAELRTQYNDLSNLPMHLTQITLLDLIQDYLQVANFVAPHLARISVSCKLGNIAPLLPQLFKQTGTGMVRAPNSRPIRSSWFPAGRSYLPPRIITTERITSSSGKSVPLPLVAVRPNLYSVTSVNTARTNNFSGNPCTLSSNVLTVASATSIPLLSNGPGHRPLVRLIRHISPITGRTCGNANSSVSTAGLTNNSDDVCFATTKFRSTTTSPSSEDVVQRKTNFLPMTISGNQDNEPGSQRLSSQPPSPEEQLIILEDNEDAVTPNLLQSESSDVRLKAANSVVDATSPVKTSHSSLDVSEVPPGTRDPINSCSIVCESTTPERTSPMPATDPVVQTTVTAVSSPANLPFTVFNHLPPASETKRLSVGSDLGTNETIPTPSTASRRRRHQTPRHVVSGQNATSNPITGAESQEDVNIERFLSALFSKPEHLATHINAKLSSLSSAHSDPVTPATESKTGTHSSDPTKNAPSAPSSDRLEVGSVSGISNKTMSSLDRKAASPVDRNENEVVNSLWDCLESDLESCVDQLLSQFDPTKLESDQSAALLNESVGQTIEVIDLMLPSGASTPAYSSCPSVPTVWDPRSENAGLGSSLAVPNSANLRSAPQTRRACSPPLCLSQLARGADESPVKRRRLNDPVERKSAKESHRPVGMTQLQTPNFKEAEPQPVLSANVPRHDLFPMEDRVKMHENCLRLGTTSITQSIAPTNYHYSADPSYASTLPFIDHAPPATDLWPAQNVPLCSTLVPAPSSQLTRDRLDWESKPDCICSSAATASNVIDGIYSMVNSCSVVDSTTAYAVSRATDSIGGSSNYCTHVPATPEHADAIIVPENPVVPNKDYAGDCSSPSVSRPIINPHIQSLTVNNSGPPTLTSSTTPWSKSVVLLGNGLQGLPLIPLNQNGNQSSVATLLFYRPTIASTANGTTMTSTSSATELLPLQPIQINTSSSTVHGPTTSLSNSVVFTLPQNHGMTWNAAPGSTVILPINVDLDGPNAHGLVSVQPSVASTVPGLTTVPGLSAVSSVADVSMKEHKFVARSSSKSAGADKENRKPSSNAAPVTQKNARRKVLNLGSIDVDQILSQSHCE